MTSAQRPILFRGEMVRAILAGRKTQTRRVMKQPNRKDGAKIVPELLADIGVGHACPYGAIGDQIYVRETWNAQCDGQWWHEMKASLSDKNVLNWAVTNPVEPAFAEVPPRWMPSIHMPRWASRITLEITGVRVERLQDISGADAVAEGIDRTSDANHWAWKDYTGNGQQLSPIFSYMSLWQSINEDRGYGWDVNPWVWVIEFKRPEGKN